MTMCSPRSCLTQSIAGTAFGGQMRAVARTSSLNMEAK